MTEMIYSALTGGLLAFLIGYYATPIGRALKVLDYPDPVGGRKRHDHITPLVGGVAIALVLTLVLAYLTYNLLQNNIGEATVAAWLSVVAVGMFLVGYTDDRLHLSPIPRLVITIALFFAASTYIPVFKLEFLYFAFLENVQFLGPIASTFTVLCLVGLVNAINMADGKNGLVIGLSIIWTVMIALNLDSQLLPVFMALLGALITLFFFNWKGRLFLGDGGSYGLAGFIGVSTIYVYNISFTNMGAEQIVLWFLVPVLDCLRLMVSRVLVGRSPFSGDRDHLHHFLALKYGWSRGIVIYLGMVGIPSLAAYFFPQLAVFMIALMALIYGTITVSVRRDLRKKKYASA